jgi:hypothetical protein
MELKDITLNTMATVGSLDQVEVSTDLIEILSRVTNRTENDDYWDAATRNFNAELGEEINQLEETIHDGIDIYGLMTLYGKGRKPERTTPATLWQEDTEGEPNNWQILIYRDPKTGSTKIVADRRCSHGFSYLVKIL